MQFDQSSINPQSSADWRGIAHQCIYNFPDPTVVDPNGRGLIVMGGDLSAATLATAYSQGLFPLFNQDEPIAWWSPDPRCVLNPADFVASKSLYKQVKKSDWSMTINAAFKQVITACRQPRRYADDTWINQDMQVAYLRLHRLGLAHSIEIWDTKQDLVGGLYGLKLGKIFCGESMFHKQSNASKIAFWRLNHLCLATGVALIDCQMPNEHLLSLGANVMSRADFLSILRPLTQTPPLNWVNNSDSLPVTALID